MTASGREGAVLEPVAPDDALGAPGGLARSPGTFALRVRGDSTAGDPIGDGDLILVQAAPAAREGDTVLAQVRGEAVVGQYHRQDRKVLLRSADEELAPVVAEEEDVEIRGVVVAVIRKY